MATISQTAAQRLAALKKPQWTPEQAGAVKPKKKEVEPKSAAAKAIEDRQEAERMAEGLRRGTK